MNTTSVGYVIFFYFGTILVIKQKGENSW